MVVRAESKDFVNWSAPAEVLRGTLDQQIYSMPVFHYEGVFLGLPAIFHTGGDQCVSTELTWSPDTVQWHRIDEGIQFIPLAEDEDSFERGCIYAAATPVVLDDEIRIYYSGQPGRHGWNPGHLAMATLRPDGWAGYRPRNESKNASVTTVPVYCTGKDLTVSCDAEGGSVTAAVVDDTGRVLRKSLPVTENTTDAKFLWQEPGGLKGFIGKKIYFRFMLENAHLFSFGIA